MLTSLRAFLCLCFIFCTLPCLAASPQDNLPEFTGWVNDYANVISLEDRSKIDALINELEAKTSAEIAVVTIASIEPYSESEYAQMLFDKWKIGKKDKDNGVIVLLAIAERKWRIHTGYGMEGVLTDAICSQIGNRQMVPYFKQKQYSQGLLSGVQAIARLVGQEEGISYNTVENGTVIDTSSNPPLLLYFVAFFFFLIWNLPWPIFIGLPFTLIFGFAFYAMSPLLGGLVALGYLTSMYWRYMIWFKNPQRKGSFLKVMIWGLAGIGGSSGGRSGGGGFSSGGSSSGGGRSSGGGSSGGGGSGGGF